MAHRTTGGHGFEFLGYKIKQGKRPLRLQASQIRSGVRAGRYAVPRAKSIQHFKDQVRQRTRRKAPVTTQELIDEINPIIRGWRQYYCKAHVRRLFHQLDGWIVRRIWSHRHKRWRNAGCKQLPEHKLIDTYGLVRPISLVPTLNLVASPFWWAPTPAARARYSTLSPSSAIWCRTRWRLRSRTARARREVSGDCANPQESDGRRTHRDRGVPPHR